MNINLTDKTALITGASRGIGEATARKLAACGANVVLAARSEKDIARIAGEIGPQAAAVVCDVANYADVAAAVAFATRKFGGLDILVNNAGLIDPIARLADSDPDAWGRVVDVNVKGVYHGIRAALPVMQARRGGVIVNISSGAASSPLEGWSHYCAASASRPAPSPPTCSARSSAPASTRFPNSTGKRMYRRNGRPPPSPGSAPTPAAPMTARISSCGSRRTAACSD
jgi:NADP-dependent 3-hydroxy acid dehydrogenase YdfG